MKKQIIKMLMTQVNGLQADNDLMRQLLGEAQKQRESSLMDPRVQEALDSAQLFSPWPGKYKKRLQELMEPLGYAVPSGTRPAAEEPVSE